MTFNTAVSGLRSANSDLSVIGNNVANASTTGFKNSRAEFADVYASAALGGGSSTIGSGVILSKVNQLYQQGNISFTNNSLDMAINGEGFFIMDNDGAVEYTRAGLFGLDQEGFVVGSLGRRLQGFQASDTGSVSGSLSDLQITTDNLAPSQTIQVDALLNLDARETSPADIGSTAATLGTAIGDVQAGNNNGYPVETVTVTLSDGSPRNITTAANADASVTASVINALPEISATATTNATISTITDNGGLEVTINGVTVVSSTGIGSITPQSIAVAINQLTNTTLRGITALQDAAAGTVTITSNDGTDLNIGIRNSTDPLDTITVEGTTPTQVVLNGDGSGDGLNATVGGTVSVTMEEGVTIDSNGDGTGIFEADVTAAPFVNNSFDPDNQDTYNHATSLSVFDSLGNSHILTMFFVKESGLNTWTMYVQVDGMDVGDPNRALDPPFDEEPGQASFNLVFNNDGTIDRGASDPVQITYWNPVDENGEPNGALEGLPVADGGVFPVNEPYTSSNFEIDIFSTTQFGSSFSVNNMSQDGFTTGRLTDIDITSDGFIFARYTNGQSQILGQLGLANFRNTQGLQPVGNTAWAETFDSGNPVVGTPGSAALGVVQSGALEESNVELSQELVKLIVAQRNFQANARTIQTADTVTQAIINIR